MWVIKNTLVINRRKKVQKGRRKKEKINGRVVFWEKIRKREVRTRNERADRKNEVTIKI